MTCSFSGSTSTISARRQQAERIAQAAQDHDGHEDQRIAEREAGRRDEAGHHRVDRAGQADQEIAEREGEDLPARDVDAEDRGGGLVDAHGVEGQSDPGALEPAHQHVGARQQDQAQTGVGEVERPLRLVADRRWDR